MPDYIFGDTVIGGSSSKSILVELRNTDNTAKTDAAHTDVTAKWLRPGGTMQTISLSALAAIDSAWSSGGWKHADNGVFRLDVPDAAIAAITGGGRVLFTFACDGCLPTNFEIGVSASNPSTVEAVVTHADYGLAKLVRSTTPANTLMVDSNHLAAARAVEVAEGSIDEEAFAAGAYDTLAYEMWANPTSNMAVAGSIGKKLADWSPGTPQTADHTAAIASVKNDTGTTLPAQIAALVVGGGTGAYHATVTVTDGTNPLQGATVRVVEGVNNNVLVTDASGNATFSLDAATWNVRVTKAGYQFASVNRTVTGEEAGTLLNDLEMTARTLPAASDDPDKCIVYVDTESMLGVAVTGLVITIDLETSQPAVSLSGKVVSNVQQVMEESESVEGRYAVELDRGLTFKAGNTTLFPVRGLSFHILPEDDTIDLAEKKNSRFRPVR